MTPLIKAEKVTRRLKGEVPVTLVQDISLEVSRGEFTVITGPSGSGKSSLLYLLALLDKPDSGRILLDGVDTTTLSEDARADIRLSKLGFVFQFHFLLPEFSALENVMLPMRKLGRLNEEAMRQRATSLLAQLGLDTQVHKLPRQLSGGQSARVAIARALANDPLMIVADEPTGNLDTHSSANVQQILRELAHAQGRAILTVTHDAGFAAGADRVLHLVDGKMQENQA
jgi:lipoprotein-releasing system ATP-binding protein